MTDRDRAAPDFGAVFTLPTTAARAETPEVHPRPYTPISAADAHESLLSGFQHDLGQLVAHMLGKAIPKGIRTVGELLHHLGGR